MSTQMHTKGERVHHSLNGHIHQQECYKNMSQLTEILQSQDEFRLHTCNINAWSELKRQFFANSAEELCECIRLQLKDWNPSEEDLKHGSNGKVYLCTSKVCNKVIPESTDKSDLKITLKIFLSRFDGSQVKNALEAIFDELDCKNSDEITIDKLIISPPDLQLAEGLTDEQETEIFLDQMKPVWSVLEELAQGQHRPRILALGVADLELPELRALHDWAPTLKPTIDHYNIQGCCAVPPELQDFAKSRGIQLLTHNGPKPFATSDRLKAICTDSLGLQPECCERWEFGWVGRYTLMIRSRSVLVAKGFVVNFQRAQDPKCIIKLQ